MERPNNVPQYDDIDLKLGIKSSLPNVKETLALFLLMWRSCGKANCQRREKCSKIFISILVSLYAIH